VPETTAPAVPARSPGSTADTLRAVALQAFTEQGYLGTSIQQIADRAGVSKASVLYHFDSKEALLAAAVAPAIERLERVVGGIDGASHLAERPGFVADFVDLLLEHRLEVHLFVNQSSSLVDVPAIQRAHALIRRLTEHCERSAETPEAKMRIGIALAGSAYMLAAPPEFGDRAQLSPDDVRAPLIAVMTELLSAARPGA
jgi:TetR/AcrR family transcriptional regulator